MTESWNAEQRAYDCGLGRDCRCRSAEERDLAEQQLDEAVQRAREALTASRAYTVPKGVEP